MNTSDPSSADFSYKKYSLEQLNNWVNDALDCEDLEAQDIYDTIVRCVDESIEYHSKYLEKSKKLKLLFKEQRKVRLSKDLPTLTTGASGYDLNDLIKDLTSNDDSPWYSPEAYGTWSKEEVREFEKKEREFERQRAILDAQTQANSPYNDGWTQEAYQKELEKIRKEGGYEWTPGT